MAFTYGDYGYAKDSSNNFIRNNNKYFFFDIMRKT